MATKLCNPAASSVSRPLHSGLRPSAGPGMTGTVRLQTESRPRVAVQQWLKAGFVARLGVPQGGRCGQLGFENAPDLRVHDEELTPCAGVLRMARRQFARGSNVAD